jgi:hypothetical protein
MNETRSARVRALSAITMVYKGTEVSVGAGRGGGGALLQKLRREARGDRTIPRTALPLTPPVTSFQTLESSAKAGNYFPGGGGGRWSSFEVVARPGATR